MKIVAFYAAALTFVFITLSIRVIRLRRQLKVGLGDGGHPDLLRASSAHANLIEYVPLGLILLMLIEQAAAPILFVHLIGGLLLVGRLAHAYGISQPNEDYRFRSVGMVLTFASLTLGAIYLLTVGLLY